MPYYMIGDDVDNPDRPFVILEDVIGKALARSELDQQEIAKTGLLIGSSSYDLHRSETAYQQQLEAEVESPIAVPFTGHHRLGEWIGERFAISSEAFNISSACTSSANALLLAHNMLSQGRLDHALVVGIELFNETTLCGFAGLQLLASHRIAPFDPARDGVILGESCSAVVLSARNDGHPAPLALLGGSSCADPYSITSANPDGSTIARVLKDAMQETRIEKSAVRAIKAHGTATLMNDTAEARGIAAAFPDAIPPVTAIKPYTGHTLGACGTLELALFGNALTRGFIPHTPNFENADPELDLSPLNNDADADSGIYLLNYFGFGGSNTVVVMEKA